MRGLVLVLVKQALDLVHVGGWLVAGNSGVWCVDGGRDADRGKTERDLFVGSEAPNLRAQNLDRRQ